MHTNDNQDSCYLQAAHIYLIEAIDEDLFEIGLLTSHVADLDLTNLSLLMRSEYENAFKKFSHFQALIQTNSPGFQPDERILSQSVKFRELERDGYRSYKNTLFAILQKKRLSSYGDFDLQGLSSFWKTDLQKA
jgi:hypothetical protein